MREPLVMTERKTGGVKETLRTLVYALAIALVVRTFAFEPFNIPSGSMKPTLLVGDYLFVSKFAYGYSRYSLPLGLPLFSGRIFEQLPERGDVVVFKLPADNKTDYIKRVIGLPGDRVQVTRASSTSMARRSRPSRSGAFIEDMTAAARSTCRLSSETLPDGSQPRDHRPQRRTARSTTPASTRSRPAMSSPWATIATTRSTAASTMSASSRSRT